jgi:hypothetical protein
VAYDGYGQIPVWTYVGSNSYNALQVQLKRRAGRLQWNVNYTWSKTITYLANPYTSSSNPNPATLSPYSQWIDTKLTKNVANRPHAINLNFGYEIPDGSRFWRNAFTHQALDGWRFNGGSALFSGRPFTVGCTAQNALPGFWTGTPTGGIPFRCQMGNNPYLPDGHYPSQTEDPRLQYAFNQATFTLPAADSLGIGNTPPTLFYGPWLINFDMSLAKDFRITERKTLEFRVETFNTLNHFNPDLPNASLNYNLSNQTDLTKAAQTNSTFGVITAAQVPARRAILSLRFRF